MRNRVERLRVWLLASALALMVVLAAFIGSARYLRRHYLAGLPARLGINITRDAGGYTDCQSVEQRKVYCMHAAKLIEHTDGKIALHDVSITLYGKKGDRSDRIYGDEFEYDKNAEVVRATGVVHIDLESAEAAGQGDHAAESGKVTHVTTSGLVYLRKFGVAATGEAIEFAAGGMTGHAVGADYSSDSGVLALHSAVTMSGTMKDGAAVAMTAATAQFDENSGQAVLTHATYEGEGRRGAADEATVDRRKDGTLSRIVAKGDVTFAAKGSTVTCAAADVALTAASRPQTAVLTGAVRYASEAALRQMHGLADEATIGFDAQSKPQPEHAVFAGGVHVTERTRTDAGAAWSVRDLTAGKVEAWLVLGGTGAAEVQDVDATGAARLSVVEDAASGPSTTELAADDLKAHLIDTGDATRPRRVDTVAGRGHTLLRQVTADGGEQSVAADSLDAKMRPVSVMGRGGAKMGGAKMGGAKMGGAKMGGAKAGLGSRFAGDTLAESLWSSVQQGHVAMMRRVPAKAGAKAGAAIGAGGAEGAGVGVEHALADRAVYDGDLDRMTLSDGVQVSDGESEVWASQIVFDHKTGDSHAVGGVKVSYAGGAASGGNRRAGAAPVEPVHVVADRADAVHASGLTTFYGRPVRLWRGGNQVQAAVIELSNAERRLAARGDGTGRTAQVLTVLAGAERGASAGAGAGVPGSGDPGCESVAGGGKKAGGGGASGPAAGVTRIVSGGLTYSGASGEADFTGGLRAETDEGTIRASEGVAMLRQGSGTAAAKSTEASGDAAAVLSGDLDRVVATGGVELDRPGLKATGRRLVYTASDGSAVLTGDARTPPKAVEPQGTTTGEALRFHTGCGGGGSVEVVGGAGQRVRTDATVSDRKAGKKSE